MTRASLQPSYRVVIIGAGIAGLTTARELLRRGLRAEELCVLEACDRIGGRVQSITFGQRKPIVIEVGAAWIHGNSEHNPFVRDLVRPAGIALKDISRRNPWLHPASCEGFRLFDGHRELTTEETAYTWTLSETLLETLRRHATADDAAADALRDRSLADIVDYLATPPSTGATADLVELLARREGSRAHLQYCLRLIECWMGATADSLQLDDFEEVDLIGDDPGAHSVVPLGMEQVIKFVHEPLGDLVFTDAAVRTVDYSAPTEVQLQLYDGRRIQADHVVVTASLGALKERKLGFVPELPAAKQAAIDRSSMGQYMKVLVEFPHVFWPEQAQFFGQLASNSHRDDGHLQFPLVFNYFSAKGAPVLEAVLFGDVALRASQWSDETIIAQFVEHVGELFGVAVPSPVDHFITRWNQHPWAVGAYSCLTIESSTEDPERLRETLGDRVLFAGEATNYRYQGALQAAYLSGLAAVDELQNLGVIRSEAATSD